MQIFTIVISVVLADSLSVEKYKQTEYTDPDCSKRADNSYSYYYYVEASDPTSVCTRINVLGLEGGSGPQQSIKWACNPDGVTVDAYHYESPNCSTEPTTILQHPIFYPRNLFRGDCFLSPAQDSTSQDMWYKFTQAFPSSTLPSCLNGDVGYVLSIHKEDCVGSGVWSVVWNNPIIRQEGSEVCFTAVGIDSEPLGEVPYAPAKKTDFSDHFSDSLTCVGDKINWTIFEQPGCRNAMMHSSIYEKAEWQRMVNGECVSGNERPSDFVGDEGKVKFQKAIAQEHLPNCLRTTPDVVYGDDNGGEPTAANVVSGSGSQRAPLMLPVIWCILLSLRLLI